MELKAVSSRHKYFISFALALLLGLQLYLRSDQPPYGYPRNELSNNYWPVIVDIAHRWRTFDFSLWSRHLGGGLCLFTTGLYPLLNPTNALAFVLNDDQFYMFKLIEPYMLGFFFMMVLLWEVLQTRWYVAVFGGLAYMGLTFSACTTITESPYFLYGCGLFPAMVWAAIVLSRRSLAFAAAAMGGLVGLQFLGEGVTQLPQVVIWLSLFLLVAAVQARGWGAVKLWPGCLGAFGLGMLAVSGLQLVPSYEFFHNESARLGGQYPIDNFAFFSRQPDSWRTFVVACLNNNGLKVLVVLMLTAVALGLMNWGKVMVQVKERRWVYALWIATLTFFCIPPAAGFLAQHVPVLERFFAPLTSFTFRYGLHIFDFCVVLSLCLIINEWKVSFMTAEAPYKWTAMLILFSALLSHFFPASEHNLKFWGKFGQSLLLAGILLLRPRHWIAHWIMAGILLSAGFAGVKASYKSYDKGKRTLIEHYQLGSPEREYYRRAQGKFMLPVVEEPEWVLDNYNLLYGVDGTCGMMAVAPKRLMKFTYFFNRRGQDLSESSFANGARFGTFDSAAPSSLTEYFPVDFTIIDKAKKFTWDGFERVVSGERFDVYERIRPPPAVHFSDELKVLDFKSLVEAFARPRSAAVYVTPEDLADFGLIAEQITGEGQARYSDFKRDHDERLSFKVDSARPVFAVVPERFEHGWRAWLDGRPWPVFPADYLFLGLRIPAGTHTVQLQFCPPGLWVGAFLSMFCLLAVWLLFRTTAAAVERTPWRVRPRRSTARRRS